MKYRVNQSNPSERFFNIHDVVGEILSTRRNLANGQLMATFQYLTEKPKPLVAIIPLDLLEPYKGD